MGRAKTVSSNGSSSRKIRPALTPDAREKQLISLAVDLAEKQLLDGTASSQVITHYLKLGSSKERLEQEIREKEKELIEAKRQRLQSEGNQEEKYQKVLNAMKKYSGYGGSDYDDDDSDLY